MAIRTQINTDSVQSLSGPKILTAPVINNGTAGADPTVALGLATKQYVDNLAASIPSGSILPYGGSAAPSAAWLLCDGAEVSRATYAALFAILGITFGVGNGSTTFNLPDLRGRVPMGIDGAANRVTAASLGGANADTRGGVGGEETHVTTLNESAPHAHALSSGSGGGLALLAGTTASAPSALTNSAGGGVAHNNMQPWIALNYIVKT